MGVESHAGIDLFESFRQPHRLAAGFKVGSRDDDAFHARISGPSDDIAEIAAELLEK
jgi:hypothetical protein